MLKIVKSHNVRGPPEHSAIGIIDRGYFVIMYIITLEHVIQNNCRWV